MDLSKDLIILVLVVVELMEQVEMEQAVLEMLEVLEKNVPGKMAQRLAGRTLKDTAELLLTAAEMAAAKKLTIDN